MSGVSNWSENTGAALLKGTVGSKWRCPSLGSVKEDEQTELLPLEVLEAVVGLSVSGDLPLTLNLTDLPLLKSLEGGLGWKEIDLPPTRLCDGRTPRKG